MEVIRTAAAFRGVTDGWREAGATVGLVPTMGSLHLGHVALIRRAQAVADEVAVSIFVNPRQFEDPADLARYPRDEPADLAVCEREGVGAVWTPPDDEIYPPGLELVVPDPGPVGATFEGAARPAHFEGVLTVVHRLFDVTGPCRACFGVKDAQQLFLVRRMVRDLLLPVEIEAVATVRERDGLAVSSRNVRLSDEERAQAGCLFLALSEAAALARAGERDASVLIATMAREIGVTPLASLDYASVVDEQTFEPARLVEGPAHALVAARFPHARLLDNLPLPAPQP